MEPDSEPSESGWPPSLKGTVEAYRPGSSMAFYILNYYGSGIPLLPEQVEANRQAWRDWNGRLKETYGIKTSRGLVVTGESVTEYQGDFKGASIIEAESLEQAAEIAKLSPAVAFGGRVEVLQEF